MKKVNDSISKIICQKKVFYDIFFESNMGNYALTTRIIIKRQILLIILARNNLLERGIIISLYNIFIMNKLDMDKS
jgi:hypothetical protein